MLPMMPKQPQRFVCEKLHPLKIPQNIQASESGLLHLIKIAWVTGNPKRWVTKVKLHPEEGEVGQRGEAGKGGRQRQVEPRNCSPSLLP